MEDIISVLDEFITENRENSMDVAYPALCIKSIIKTYSDSDFTKSLKTMYDEEGKDGFKEKMLDILIDIGENMLSELCSELKDSDIKISYF